MNDWNEVLDAGDVAKGVINVVVEIPAGSNNKVEWRRDLGLMMLDRVEPEVFALSRRLWTKMAMSWMLW